MAIPTFSPPVGPTFPVGPQTNPRVNWAQFGDGYKQGAPDGLNHMDMTLSPVWENLTSTEKDSIITFFEAREGNQPFSYTLDGETRTYVALSWSSQKNSPNSYVVQAEFERNFSA